MRIFLISDTMGATHGEVSGHGLGRANFNLAVNLSNAGHEVTLFGAPGSSFPNGRTIISSGIGVKYEPELAKAAYNLRHECDVFIEANHKHPLAMLFHDLPIVNLYHDKWQPYRPNAVLMSEGQRALMEDERFQNAKVLHHQFDAREFLPSYRPDNPPYALFIGFIYKWKQPLLAIEAAARFGMKLTVAGSLQEGLDALDTEHNNCQWIGAQHPLAIRTLLRGASVYLQLGDNESFGLTTIEAGLSGCPVVAWPSGGNLDTVAEGANGTFVDVTARDKVGSVSEAMHRAIGLPRNCVREWTEARFGCPQKQVTELEALMESVIEGKRW